MPPNNARWSPTLVRTVAILLLLYALSLLDRHLLALVVEPVRADLRISEVQIGLLQGFAFSTFYVLCGVPLGWAADVYSRRLVIFIGVVFWSLATAACGLAYDFHSLLIARFGVGMGEAALIPAAYSLIGAVAPRAKLSMAMAVFSTGAIVGSGAANIFGGLLVKTLEDIGAETLGGHTFEPWQLAFLIVGVLGLPLALLALALPDPSREADAGQVTAPAIDSASFRDFLASRWRFFVPHFLGFSFIYFVSAAGSAWAPTFLQRTYGWNMAQAGSSIGFAVLGFGVIGFLFAGYWIDKQLATGRSDAPLRYFTGGALFLVVIGGVAPHLGSGGAYAVLYGSTHLFTVCAAAAGTALTLVTPPQFRARVAAMFTVVFNLIGSGAGPYFVGVLTQEYLSEDALGLSLSIAYIVGGLLAATFLVLAIKPLRDLALTSSKDAGLQRTS